MIAPLFIAFANPPYSKLLEFVRQADVVVTCISHDENGREDVEKHTSNKSIRAFNTSHKRAFIRRFDAKSRDSLVTFLRGVVLSGEATLPGCFEPHHFVYAIKGKKHLTFEICFTCNVLQVTGAMTFISNSNRASLAVADKIFGMKFNPRLVDSLPATDGTASGGTTLYSNFNSR